MFIKNGNIPKLATIPEEQGKETGFKDSLATYVLYTRTSLVHVLCGKMF